ncbi:hypothetical protein TRP8649_00711 [Pelagimonas phthalicica]|uniref:Uncharacterized protein n=1 Tax=Pelagimonas phthalicica TaxID=1037362 RepID=A0A238J9S3_9RHOB|nr:hypothetical protein [Pelagimonas phthalicica]TDS94845.1 hypothetical protein CLV87_1360 [Pelagimonas phthalicica]SMX26626.1 hypothetical protein TRP8649_00711 [Pelagimonas phthalicica]
MYSKPTLNRICRLSAWYDLIITWPFALPITLGILWQYGFMPLNAVLGFAALPALDVHAVLFGNFFGSVVVIWALVRLYLNDSRLALFDGLGRVLFSVAMVNALMAGISPIIWAFLIPELAWAIAQLIGFVRFRTRVEV